MIILSKFKSKKKSICMVVCLTYLGAATVKFCLCLMISARKIFYKISFMFCDNCNIVKTFYENGNSASYGTSLCGKTNLNTLGM